MVDHEQEETASREEGSKIPVKQLTNNQMISQAILFMSAGTETTSTVLSYVSYNLAMYQDIQDKLIEEVDTVLAKYVILIRFNSPIFILPIIVI